MRIFSQMLNHFQHNWGWHLLFVVVVLVIYGGTRPLGEARREIGNVPYVLVVRNPNGSITMQEFNTKLRCEYAAGLAKGLSESTIGDCAEK